MNFIKKYRLAIALVSILITFIKPELGFIIIGSVLTFVSIASFFFLKNIYQKGIECIGTIIEYKSDGDGNKIPVIKFMTMNGEHIRNEPFIYISTDLSKIRTYKNKIAQPVSVLYYPPDPEKFILKNEKGPSSFVLIIVVLAGLFCLGFGIGRLLGFINIG